MKLRLLEQSLKPETHIYIYIHYANYYTIQLEFHNRSIRMLAEKHNAGKETQQTLRET